MTKNNLHQVYENARILFVLKGCPTCRTWKHFIERENLKLKPGKRILVIDGTLLAEQGIYDSSYLRVYDKFIQDPPGSGSYFFPALFIDGKLITGANTQEEALWFIRGFLHDDYIQPYDRFEFNKECEYIRKGGKRILVCGGQELG